MNFKSVILVLSLFVTTSLAQISPAFFGATFPSGFVSPFSDYGSLPSSPFPGDGAGRSNTGPILFPPAPESRDTSGVVIGASGYGFVPPGGKGVVQGRGMPSASFSASFDSSPFSPSFFRL